LGTNNETEATSKYSAEVEVCVCVKRAKISARAESAHQMSHRQDGS